MSYTDSEWKKIQAVVQSCRSATNYDITIYWHHDFVRILANDVRAKVTIPSSDIVAPISTYADWVQQIKGDNIQFSLAGRHLKVEDGRVSINTPLLQEVDIPSEPLITAEAVVDVDARELHTAAQFVSAASSDNLDYGLGSTVCITGKDTHIRVAWFRTSILAVAYIPTSIPFLGTILLPTRLLPTVVASLEGRVKIIPDSICVLQTDTVRMEIPYATYKFPDPDTITRAPTVQPIEVDGAELRRVLNQAKSFSGSGANCTVTASNGQLLIHSKPSTEHLNTLSETHATIPSITEDAHFSMDVDLDNMVKATTKISGQVHLSMSENSVFVKIESENGWIIIVAALA